MAGPVRVGSYFDVVEANLARARLEAEGIDARVVEPAAFNPLLNDAAGGITLEVGALDAAQARTVLAEKGTPDEDDDDDDVVRCPRCELQYCGFEHYRLRGPAAVAGSIFLLLPAAIGLLGPKRWRCHKCEHVWEDPKAGPKRITRSQPGDPLPVFLLRRSSSGMGLFLGFLAGAVSGLFLGSPKGGFALVGLSVLGWLIGQWRVCFVCSEPTCRKPLHLGSEECEACGGSVAGKIDRASEHFSAAADFRREVATTREPPYRNPPGKRRAKKQKRPG